MAPNNKNFGNNKELYDELKSAGRYDVDITGTDAAGIPRQDLNNLIGKYAHDESSLVEGKEDYILVDNEANQAAQLAVLGPMSGDLVGVSASLDHDDIEITGLLEEDQESEVTEPQENEYGIDVIR